jgi:hypothetical protein
MEATDKKPITGSKRARRETRKREARKEKGKVEAEKAGMLHSIVEFQ